MSRRRVSPYALPVFLSGELSPSAYHRWLGRKAAAHVRRDRKRWRASATRSGYKQAIHRAVVDSEGLDGYTGEKLKWGLLARRRYDNTASKRGGAKYKKRYWFLPTVDHVPWKGGRPAFVICGWRTNDAKNDLTHRDFVALCKKVVAHQPKRGKRSR